MMDDELFGDAAQKAFNQQQQYGKMWSDFAATLTKAGMAFSPEDTPPDAARSVRTNVLKAWSQYCDDFLRSEEFVNTMKQSMKQSIEFKKQMNQMMGNVHHEFQGASRQDIDHLMQTISHLERRIIDSVERMESQLDAMGKRMDTFENKKPSIPKKTTVKPKKSTAKKRSKPAEVSKRRRPNKS